MKRRIISIMLAALMLSSILLAGCAQTSNEALVVGTEKHGGFYNYMYSSSAYDRQVCQLVYDRLVIEYGSGISRPNDLVVKEHKVSEDGKSYEFTIKKGIKFADGTEMKASDIVFTYKTLCDPSTVDVYMRGDVIMLEGSDEYGKGDTKDVKFIEAKDDYTVVFHFKDNTRTNMSACGIGILSEKYYPDWEYGKANEAMEAKMNEPMGSGPYAVLEYKADQYTTLQYRDKYWADKDTDYLIKNITIKFTQGDTEIQEILSQEVDVLPSIIDKDYVDKVTADGSDYIDQIRYKRSAYGYIGFNTNNVDKAMRQAVAYAFDRQKFVDTMYGAELARTLSVPMSQASSIFEKVEPELNKYERSMEKAKEVLEKGGYKLEGDVLKKDGKPVKLKFLATTGNPVINGMMPTLKQDMKELGVEINESAIEFASLLDVIQNKDKNDWDMMFLASSWDTDEPDTWYSVFHSSGIAASNLCRYNNPKIDQLLEDGRKVLDLTSKEALDIYSEVAKILNDDMPQLPIYANNITCMVNKRVKGLKTDTFTEWNYALQGVTVEAKKTETSK